MKLDRIFNSAVLASLHLINANMVYREVFFQKVTGRQGNVTHLIKVLSGLLPEPFVNLLSPKGFIAYANKEFLNFFD